MWNDVPHQTQCELRVSIHNVIITNVDWSNLHKQMYTGKQIFKAKNWVSWRLLLVRKLF